MLTVAVLEDDRALRSALERALRQAGHRTLVAATGAEAMRGFVATDPDVIVLDVGLPDADGRDVCLALRSAGVVAPIEVGATDTFPAGTPPIETVAPSR